MKPNWPKLVSLAQKTSPFGCFKFYAGGHCSFVLESNYPFYSWCLCRAAAVKRLHVLHFSVS